MFTEPAISKKEEHRPDRRLRLRLGRPFVSFDVGRK
jgi:hypothetical protein